MVWLGSHRLLHLRSPCGRSSEARYGSNIFVCCIVGIDECLVEDGIDVTDDVGVLVEWEGLEGVFAVGVERATSRQVFVQIHGLESSGCGPGICGVLSAPLVVYIHRLVPMTSWIEAEPLANTKKKSVKCSNARDC